MSSRPSRPPSFRTTSVCFFTRPYRTGVAAGRAHSSTATDAESGEVAAMRRELEAGAYPRPLFGSD